MFLSLRIPPKSCSCFGVLHGLWGVEARWFFWRLLDGYFWISEAKGDWLEVECLMTFPFLILFYWIINVAGFLSRLAQGRGCSSVWGRCDFVCVNGLVDNFWRLVFGWMGVFFLESCVCVCLRSCFVLLFFWSSLDKFIEDVSGEGWCAAQCDALTLVSASFSFSALFSLFLLYGVVMSRCDRMSDSMTFHAVEDACTIS